MHQFAHGGSHGINLLIHHLRERRISGLQPGFPHGFRLHTADPPIEYERQSAALRLCFRGEIADELAVCGKALAPCALQPPFRGEIRVRHNEAPIHHIIADCLEQKALAGTIPAHNKAERSAAFCNDVHIVQQRFDLVFASHSDIGQANPRHHTTLERV